MLNIHVKKSKIHGFGVFASSVIPKGEVIERCPFVIVEENDVTENAILQNYLFGTPFLDDERTIAPLGYAMLYNHSVRPHAEWYADEHDMDLIVFVALKDINKGTEIVHSYGDGYWSSRSSI